MQQQPNSSLLTVDQEERLKNYVLPLALHVDNFNSNGDLSRLSTRQTVLRVRKYVLFIHPPTAAGLVLFRFQSLRKGHQHGTKTGPRRADPTREMKPDTHRTYPPLTKPATLLFTVQHFQRQICEDRLNILIKG